MSRRPSRGRQVIPMRPIQNPDDMYATFSKRRLGLYKKASELSTLCGVDMGIIIFSPTNNPFSFFSPCMDSVVARYQNPNQPISDVAEAMDSHTRGRLVEHNERLDCLLTVKEQLNEQNMLVDEINNARPKGWWEQDMESLDLNQVDGLIEWFENIKNGTNNRMEALINGVAAMPPAFQQSGASSYILPILGVEPTSFPIHGVGPSTLLSNLEAPGPSSYGPMEAMHDPNHGHNFPSLYQSGIDGIGTSHAHQFSGPSSHVTLALDPDEANPGSFVAVEDPSGSGAPDESQGDT